MRCQSEMLGDHKGAQPCCLKGGREDFFPSSERKSDVIGWFQLIILISIQRLNISTYKNSGLFRRDVLTGWGCLSRYDDQKNRRNDKRFWISDSERERSCVFVMELNDERFHESDRRFVMRPTRDGTERWPNKKKRTRVPPDGVRVYPTTSGRGHLPNGSPPCMAIPRQAVLVWYRAVLVNGSRLAVFTHIQSWRMFLYIWWIVRWTLLLQMVWTRVLLSSRFLSSQSGFDLVKNYERSVSAPNGVLVPNPVTITIDCFMTDVPIWNQRCLHGMRNYRMILTVVTFLFDPIPVQCWRMSRFALIHFDKIQFDTVYFLTRFIHDPILSLKITPKFEERGQFDS